MAGLALLGACSAEKFVADDELMLQKVRVLSDNPNVNASELKSYVRQKVNTKWLSTFKVPLGLYAMSGKDTTKWVNRTLQKWGEKPVILDSTLTQRSILNLAMLTQNKGYLDAEVLTSTDTKGKKAKLTYVVHSGEPYIIRGFATDIDDSKIDTLLSQGFVSKIQKGHMFSVNLLNDERKRITSYLQDRGYYLFNKEFITFDVDSSTIDKSVYVTMHLSQYRKNNYTSLTDHPCYVVRSVNYSAPSTDTLNLRRRVLELSTAITPGKEYNATDLLKTYNNFARLQAVKYTSIRFDEDPDSQYLDCHIQLSSQKKRSLLFQPEGTNTAGDIGAAASVTYQNRNMFRGSEVLNITFRGAYEAISGLEGYKNQNYKEYGAEAGLTFPQLIFPGLSYDFRRKSNATSELIVSYDLQDRPEFHRRLFNATWRYRWQNQNKHSQYKIDVLDLNYISMPWISERFKHDYLDSVSNRNVILKYNYEDLFIMKLGFGYTWSYKGNTLRLNVESAGNLLNALARPFNMKRNGEGEYQFMDIAFAQYVKGDFDYTHSLMLDDRNTLVLHGRLGIAYPYGNSTVLPFEKRYFSGGANSLRGWSVRSLGPGKYKGKNGSIDFINQTGDIRLDLNMELRSILFWKFQGAFFIDAGNIWTIREYADQPLGRFDFATFWDEIAMNYGFGLRLNFDYFVLRFDMGVKAINPAYSSKKEHFPLLNPKLSRDCQFHFAVGMPF